MSKTLTQGLTLLTTKLDTSIDGGTFGEDAEQLIQYLNDAQASVVFVLPDRALNSSLVGYQVKAAGTAIILTWSKPSDFLRNMAMYAGTFGNTGIAFKHLERVDDPNEFRRKVARSSYPSATNEGTFYTIDGDMAMLWPLYSGDTYSWKYVKTPPALSSTQGFTVPDYLFDVVTDRAVELALLQLGKGELHKVWKERTDNRMAEIMARL